MPENANNNFRRLLLWLTLVIVGILTVASIIAAAKGAVWAKTLFNSSPFVLFWMAFTLLMTFGMISFPRLKRQTPLLLIHAGAVFTLLGAMWSSPAGHLLQKTILDIDKPVTGTMRISENTSENHIYDQDLRRIIAALPFEIYLHDFTIDYYWDRANLLISTANGDFFKIPAIPGQTIELTPPLPTIRIIKQYKNCKISIENETITAIEQIDKDTNPALELELQWPNGEQRTKFLFVRFPDFGQIGNDLFLRYSLMPSEYLSDLEIRRDGKTVLRKTIEVNKPLHYGGYYFYQSSYDEKHGRFTELSVTSDTGRPLVFAGYALLAVGLFWHFWITKLLAGIRKQSHGN